MDSPIASQFQEADHVVLFPFLAASHMIPTLDLAKLLAARDLMVRVLTTQANATRIETIVSRANATGLRIQTVALHFPSEQVGLPVGCESFDLLPSQDLAPNFMTGTWMLHKQADEVIGQELTPRPKCIISDVWLPFTSEIATKLGIPRVSLALSSCFFCLCVLSLHLHQDFLGTIASRTDYFVFLGFPDEIEFTKTQLPECSDPNTKEFLARIAVAERASYGVIVNSFQELEPAYVEACKKLFNGGGKVWCIGPFSLYNEGELDHKVQRNFINENGDNEGLVMKWLDTQESGSALYACFGSMCDLMPSQLIEIGLGLEASKKPFIWVVKENDNNSGVFGKWVEENKSEEKIKGIGLLIRGWAPQVLILSHPSVGGFLTHCGWNSVIEAMVAGLPLITWPSFGDTFCNEKLFVEVLRVGVRVGVEQGVGFVEDEMFGVLVKKEEVTKAVNLLMDGGEETEKRRERARHVGKLAKKAVEKGASSYLNLTMLIEGIRKEAHEKNEGV